MVKTIELLPTQVEHVERLEHILSFSPFALDLSSLGSGKTYASSYIATNDPERFKHIVVVAPVSVKTKWLQMKKEYGVPVSAALSYCELRSVKCKQPKHGLLYRRDFKVPHVENGRTIEIDKVTFAPSEKFDKMVAEGMLLVVDEIQNVKNISTQFLACQAMIKTVVRNFTPESKSRVLMLSGSPIDKMEQAIVLFRTLDITKQDRLARINLQTYRMVWEGMQDIYDYCMNINPEKLNQVVASFGGQRYVQNFRDGSLRRFCYDLFQQVVKPAISSAMLPPQLGFSLNKRNGFYHIIDNAEAQLLTNAVYNLGNVARFTNNRIDGHMGIQSLRAISAALLQIETAKIGTFARIAREALDNHPHQKVAICVNYSTTITDLVAALADFKPVVLDGSVSMNNRAKVLEKFQAPNTECRLIIGNVSVMSTGIDLDDKNGNFPRIAFVSANYSTINLYQLAFRFLRSDSKSPADIYFVYGQHAKENKILEALSAKSKVMKATTPEQAQHGVVFPNDHETFHELPPEGFTPREPFVRESGMARRTTSHDREDDPNWEAVREAAVAISRAELDSDSDSDDGAAAIEAVAAFEAAAAETVHATVPATVPATGAGSSTGPTREPVLDLDVFERALNIFELRAQQRMESHYRNGW